MRVALLFFMGLFVAMHSSNAQALLISQFVDDPYITYTGGVPYDTAFANMYLDPENTIWLAWNTFPDVRIPNPANENEFYLGNGGFGTDDYFDLTITNPTGQSQTVRMDYNNFSGISSGPQNVIFGSEADAPDAYRCFTFSQIFDEAGAFNSIFNVAGDYGFSFAFGDNQNGDSATHDEIWLIGEVYDSSAPIVPEPSTIILLFVGLLGLMLLGKYKIHKIAVC